ncbi:MAG: class I SAM-dependent methyltransferase [Gemmatimonadetes bacterium]|nr:class I SAM-dependent methyltransferase [Gemmatimonadota bacterium]
MSWVREAFGDWYLKLYPHRDAEEARSLVRTLHDVVDLSGRLVLDIGCGPGRHLVPMRDAGARPAGVDYSRPLLAEAVRVRAEAGGDWPLVRGDMRALPLAAGRFDGVTSLFTSFGYFGEEEDTRALREAARVLRPGGFHLLDFLNPDAVRAHPTPETERVAGDWRIRETRRIVDGRRVVKRVQVAPRTGGADVADYEENVMLYEGDELRDRLAACGLTVRHEWGDYGGGAFHSGSARHLFLSERSGECR